ncbi:MAG TPA: TIM-barrel domain-containing protein, partial [Terriglobales bacterium]|nr:TIM-barrel domain-containing protein [Terriglobales bacterium]
TWETLKTHIAVGINAGLSGIPYWGTDTGGFIPTREYTGELYARWFQFSAFCPLFRSHGRDWRLHLPWGWTTGEIGYDEEPEYRPDAAEPLTLTVYPGADGGGALYEDDGASFDFERGKFMRLEFTWRDRQRELRLRLGAGRMRPPQPRPLQIRVAGETTQRRVQFDGRPLAIKL